MEFEPKNAELPGRLNLAYVETGTPGGTPVVFLHGYTDSWCSFETVLQQLPDSIHAFALTQRGHGDTDRPAEGYGIADFVKDLVEFISIVGIGPCILVGHSMGSFIAQRFAIDFPELAQGVVLLGSSDRMAGNPAWLEFKEAALTLSDPIDPAFVREFQESTLAKPVPDAFLETIINESLKVPASIWQKCWQALSEVDYSDELNQIQGPALIVWGDHDELFSRDEQYALTERIPNSQISIYPDAGHGLHWEYPERFAADLASFIRGIAR